MTADNTSSFYIHGASPDEQRRLAALNELINSRCFQALDLRGVESILDVGSGLGQFPRLLANHLSNRKHVVGVEHNPQQLAEARRLASAAGEVTLVDFRQGDALALPLRDDEWGTFDLAHTRFLLEHVRDPLAVVRQMVRAVRPGGRIVLADDDHELLRLWPESPGFVQLWQAYMRSYDRHGNDPYIGRRLVSLLHQAGARPTGRKWIDFGSCVGEATFQTVVTNLIGILLGARATVLAESLLDADSFDEAIESLRTWGRRADGVIWYAINWAEGVRPA
jgi:ubiquinone/menaquinone biosynthesis C-methylase UbiE